MDKSVFLYWWFSFDLSHYLILGGTNNMLHTSVKKILCTLWSLALPKHSCNNINNSRSQVSRLGYFLWLCFKVACRVQILKKTFSQNSNRFGYSFIKNDIMFMYVLCIYKKNIILSLFKIDKLNFTTYISTILTCFLKVYIIGLHSLILINIFFCIKDHSFSLLL